MDDVVVVGAGPGGNLVAYLLARQGYKVSVIEKREKIGDELCSGIVSAECFSRFPSDESVVLRKVSSASFISPKGLKVRLAVDQPQAYILDRVAYVASFARRAMEAGAAYVEANVLNVQVSPQRVEVLLERGKFTEVSHAKAAVISPGFGSRLTQDLGLGVVRDFGIGAQLEVKAPGADEVRIYFGQGIAPSFFAWLVPTAEGRALAGLIARRNAGQYLRGFLMRLREEGLVEEMLSPISQWGVPLAPLERIYRDRVLVLGDAAGQTKPTTGGGIFYSLLAAEEAFVTLDQALTRNYFSAPQMSSYQKAWKRRMGRDIGISLGARRIFESLKDEHLDLIMEAVATHGISADLIHSKELSFDWHGGVIVRALGHPLISRSLSMAAPLASRMAAALLVAK